MQRFKKVKNNCRLCEKVFCCDKCRIKHEIDIHKVFPNCDLCIYGLFVLENIEDSYLQHLETSHLPLNCVNCKRVFGRIEEILQHKKCPARQIKVESPTTAFNQGTPAILISTDEQDSPILQELQRKEALNYIFNLATSTPMQRGQEHNLLFDKSNNPTPSASSIISTHNNSQLNKSIIKKDSLKSDNSSNRRVTFGETPKANIANRSMKILDDKCFIATSDSDYSDKKDSDVYQTPSVTGMSTGKFYSAISDVESEFSSKTASERVTIPEGSTPVPIPNASKTIAGKNIYEAKDLEINGKAVEPSKEPFEDNGFKRQDCGLNNVSMEICTPGMSTGTFYSARSDMEGEASSKTASERVTSSIAEGSTPVSIPNSSKIIAAKDIYEAQDLETNVKVVEPSKEPSKCDGFKKQDCDSNIVSMETCTPAGPSIPLKEEISSATPEIVANNISRESNAPESDSPNYVCTDAKETLLKNTTNAREDNQPSEKESNQEQKDESSDKENIYDNNYDNRQTELCDVTQGKTLWLSAVNLEEFNDAEELNENRNLDINDKRSVKSESESPLQPARRRVSIVMPTPILKRTNVQMKFHIPAHMSSTPILSSGIVKMKKTKIVEEIATRVTNQETPFKTPQGKLSELSEESLMGSSIGMIFERISDAVAAPSREQYELAPLSQTHESYPSNETDPCTYITTDHAYNNESQDVAGISVSSMTESSLWTSMTRIVKSVIGGFTNVNPDSDVPVNDNSFKRQLSDDEASEDFLEAPRFKRFKFTDIKCRRPIRKLPALEPSRRVPAPARQIATFEIVKSVSTLYGKKQVKVQCDKATQTDDYLLYGWHPHI